MVDHDLDQTAANTYGFETPERAREAWDAFENGNLMLGGIYEAQNLAEDVPHSGLTNLRVADSGLGVCDTSRIPRTGIRRPSV
jgi:hypothetical protein